MNPSEPGARRPAHRSFAAAVPLIALVAAGACTDPVHAQDGCGSLAVERPGVEWTRWGRAVVLLGGVLAMDQPVRSGSHDLRSGAGDALAAAGDWLGDWRRTAPLLMGGALLIGTLSDGSRGTKRGVAMVMGVLAGSAANEALNVAVGRARPADGGDPWHFDPFEGHAAFPSGHAAYAFAVAGAIDAATDSWVPAAMAYAAATLTGASRIYDDRHWLSDVAIGALVGGWTAARVTRAAMDALGVSSRQDPLTASRSWLERVAPVATAGFVGLRVQF